MAEYTVSANDLGALFKSTEEARIKDAQSSLLEAAQAGVEVVVRKAPKDTSLLRQSAHAEQVAGGAAIILDAPYSAIVDLGSRPHTPPLAPLVEWVMRRLDLSDEKEAMGVARSIQMHIAQHGTKPTFFVRDSVPELERILVSIMSKRLAAK